MNTSVDMYELKREHKDYNDALDLLYILYLASKSENLNLKRYSVALHLVWQHMSRIEERMSATMEASEEPEEAAGAAANEA
ncbi:MAG: hypothetical protein IJV43_00125 [Oscillospiraceae bacterium]|nr:hypothetical protein [Oscillospiraceae bacterium]